MKKKLFLLLLGLFSAFTTSAWSQQASTQPSVTLRGAGATFPYPLYSKWFHVYRGTQFEYEAIGSDSGIEQLRIKSVDFAASDYPLAGQQLTKMSLPVEHIPSAAGAIVIGYNLPELAKQKKRLKLNGRVLAGIYLGHIRYWNDARIQKLNPHVKLPEYKIRIQDRHPVLGSSYAFCHYLFAVSSEWQCKVGAKHNTQWPLSRGGRSGESLHVLIKEIRGSISYLELAYAKQNHVPYAAIQNRSGHFIVPEVSGVTAAITHSMSKLEHDICTPIVNASGRNSYPICQLSYLLVPRNKSNPRQEALKTFLCWTQSEGQQHASRLLYAPLPYALRQRNLQIIESL